MADSAPRSAEAVAERFLLAYNERDIDTLDELFGEQIRVVHYGRGVDTQGHDAVVAMFRASLSGAFPDRRFLPARRRLIAGEHVIVEHTWEATAVADSPAYGAKAGEQVTMELVTIITVADGKIVDYTEYG
jgi:ketosteroid isomerase-like protein